MILSEVNPVTEWAMNLIYSFLRELPGKSSQGKVPSKGYPSDFNKLKNDTTLRSHYRELTCLEHAIEGYMYHLK